MKKLYRSAFLSLILISVLLADPASAAQDGPVIASAVVMPAQTYRLSFLTSAMVKEIAVQEGDQVKAGDILAVLNTPDLEYNVIAAQEAYRSAQTNADLQRHAKVLDFRKGKKVWDPVPREVWEKAEAQAASAQAAVEVAEAIVALTTLSAPREATVASVDVIPGQLVLQGETVLTLATLDQLQLETTDLSERDIANVEIGAPVNISIEALDETFSGEVVSISPMADTVGGDVVFTVIIDFDRQPENVRWGMTAEVTIEESS
jgi:RND family efflux transporter MFP subunit